MKIGIIGTGAVGTACALSVILRGCAREIVLIDKAHERAQAVAIDMHYGSPHSSTVDVRDGNYSDLTGAAVVMITAGVNEKTGGATDRSDPAGRLRLLDTNAKVYEEIVPQIVQSAPEAVILVVTDPPDPLADIARHLAGHDRVVSTGTWIDSLRFRVHLAKKLSVNAASIEALVVGEHGTSQVFLWSSARVCGAPFCDLLEQCDAAPDAFRAQVESEVRYANITIIEGNNASQYGIGMTCAQITEIILRDENAVVPVGSYNKDYGVTLSLPSILGRYGVSRILQPEMTNEERLMLQRSAEKLKSALSGRL
ncbi:MAG TPA: NAD(P)-binding domain-containing protein [Nitrospirota bacterium]|nr:NAD(P)-binding domain-containing protein [Nitrospirota bacterium]